MSVLGILIFVDNLTFGHSELIWRWSLIVAVTRKVVTRDTDSAVQTVQIHSTIEAHSAVHCKIKVSITIDYPLSLGGTPLVE